MTPPTIVQSEIDTAIDRAQLALLAAQAPDGHWVGELEANSTITSEYLLFCHFLDRVDRERDVRPGESPRRFGDRPVASARRDEVHALLRERARDLRRVARSLRRRVDELDAARLHLPYESAHASAPVALAGGGVVDEDAAFHEGARRAPEPRRAIRSAAAA